MHSTAAGASVDFRISDALETASVDRHGCFHDLGLLFLGIFIIPAPYHLGSILATLIFGNSQIADSQ